MDRRIQRVDWALVGTTAAGLAMLLAKEPVRQFLQRLPGGFGEPVTANGVALAGVLLASSSFVAVGVRSARGERSHLSLLLLFGLLLCWTGDVVGYMGYFVPSAAAFLVGHLLFASGFVAMGLDWRRAGIASAVLAILSLVLALWFLPHVPPAQKPLILGYIVVISLMVASAWGTRHPNMLWLAIAASLFYLSDIAVAYWRFMPGDNSRCAFLCYPLYYPACLLLALGSRRR